MGTLPNYVTVTAYEVTPVVARRRRQQYRVDPFEVADVLKCRCLTCSMSATGGATFMRDGKRREYWAPWRERYIWGATAGMLHLPRSAAARNTE